MGIFYTDEKKIVYSMYNGLFKNVFFFANENSEYASEFWFKSKFSLEPNFFTQKKAVYVWSSKYFISREFNGNILLGDIGQFL